MTPLLRQTKPAGTNRIADYLDSRADRFVKDGRPESRIRANALRVEASNIRAGLVDE